MKLLACLLLFPLWLAPATVLSQSTSATISGGVTDPAGHFITGAWVEIANDETGVRYSDQTNSSGMYFVPILPPGHYRVQVSKQGFKTIIKPDVVLNVQGAVALNFVLPVGSTSQSITVEAGSALLNTTDATVSTVVDRKFVETLPLNGRSFQDLISMTPGVVTASPQGTQGAGAVGFSGDFSVNGQRTESNYYTVDGVSGNVSAGNGYGVAQAANSGGIAAGTAFGTTQALTSVDALQEFRVLSSTYSAEYGHSPGGQFSLSTRSGTNSFHGTAFDYLRNNFFDANDWFNNHYGEPVAALRQNDFGGTFGGPVRIPKLYEGKEKTFFFVSYEGLRITQPQAASIQYVPDSYMRQQAPAALQPLLNAYPVQNGIDYGSFASPSLAQFILPYALPGYINSTSGRVDHTFSQKLVLFFRVSDTTSSSATRSQSVLTSLNFNTLTYTAGATSQLSQSIANELRLGFSHSDSSNTSVVDDFAGAQPADITSLMGAGEYPHAHALFIIFVANVGTGQLLPQSALNLQSQWNANDAVSIARGRNQLKLGIDYRWIRSPLIPASPTLEAYFTTASQVLSNKAAFGEVFASSAVTPIFNQFAAFVQNDWKIRESLSLSTGLRWEVNPTPSEEHGQTPYTLLGNIANPASLQLAAPGTPIWNTAKFNFAPRLGIAWTVHTSPGWETVFRTGGGVYFSNDNAVATQGYKGIGYQAQQIYQPTSIPFASTQVNLMPSTLAPYTSSIAYAFPAHMQAPYTYQWNASLEQALGRSQTFTLSYIGANGRRLIGQQQLTSIQALNPEFGTVIYFATGITSNYQALQLQFQRSVTHGVQALASYTWSHSLDFGSNDTTLPLVRGNSDFDVRHNFQAGLSWEIPTARLDKFSNAILEGWGLDARALVRTAFPITLAGNTEINSATGDTYYSGLNYDPSRPVYLYGSQYPGGRAINGGVNNTANPAFTIPTGTNVSGNAPRNFVRGFGLSQVNLAMRRQFILYKETTLQFRAETFNLFNHPNFGYVFPGITGAQFGQATTMLNGSLGTVAAQYQQGGARSMQFSLRLRF
jgi:hypothetical protein